MAFQNAESQLQIVQRDIAQSDFEQSQIKVSEWARKFWISGQASGLEEVESLIRTTHGSLLPPKIKRLRP